MKLNFSKSAIDALELPSSKRCSYSDQKVRGLHLVVHPSGRKQFFLVRRIGTRVERITLGTYPDMPVDAARRRAEGLNSSIAEGRNPANDRRTERNRETFGELFELYLERYAKPRKRSWKGDLRLWNRYLKPMANRRLAELSRRDFSALHSEIGKTKPVTANRVLSLVSCIFGRAYEWEIWEGKNPCKGIRFNREVPRSRFLRASELRRFLISLENEPCDTARDLLGIALLTGARQANVLQMRWSEIDFVEADWVIPAEKFKTGRSMTIPLTPDAMVILRRRREITSSPWVFPALREDSDTGHFRGIAIAWKRVVLRTEALGLAEMIAERTNVSIEDVKERIWNQVSASRSKHAMKRSRMSATDAVMESLRSEVTALGLDPGIARVRDLRMHDLRHTLASWQAKTGASLSIIGRSLGQKDLKTTMAYVHLDMAPVRESMEKAGAAMMAVGRPPIAAASLPGPPQAGDVAT